MFETFFLLYKMFWFVIASSESTVLSIVTPQKLILLQRDLRIHTKQPEQLALTSPKNVIMNVLFSDTKSLKEHIIKIHYKFLGDLRTWLRFCTALTACRSPLRNRSNCCPVKTGSKPNRGLLLTTVSGVAGVICAKRSAALCVGRCVTRRSIISSAAVNLGLSLRATWSGSMLLTPRFFNVIF